MMQVGSSPFQGGAHLVQAEAGARARPPSKVESEAREPVAVRSTVPDSGDLAAATLAGGASSLLAPGAVLTMQASSPVEEDQGAEAVQVYRDQSDAAEQDGSRVADRDRRRTQHEREVVEIQTEVEPARAREALDAYRVAAFGAQTESAAATRRPDIRDLSV